MDTIFLDAIPLRIALFVKGTPATLEREKRNMGYWSYPVVPFTWDIFSPGMDFNNKNYDLVFVEDGAPFPDCKGLPSIYLSIDSTLDDVHLSVRKERAVKADLVLLDHDKVERFNVSKKVLQWNYCVNDHVFKPQKEKSIGVNFRCSSGAHKGYAGGKERDEIRSYLNLVCANGGWRYVSGTTGLEPYALDMGFSKVVINWPRTVINRPHRIFDAMACKCCILTGPIPYVIGDNLSKGEHYVEFRNKEELPIFLEGLLWGDGWRSYAEAGYDLVMREHTWKIRAEQLRKIIRKEFGL